MGMGDELMAMGQARALARASGKKVLIVDRHNHGRWHPLWNGSDYIARPSAARSSDRSKLIAMINGSGCRPYIDYARTIPERWAYTNWSPPLPGELRGLTLDPRARDCVLIEPMIKPKASPNKQWGRWQELVDSAPDVHWAQMSPELLGLHWLRGVKRIHTKNFAEACRAILACRTAVFPEGGLHHAAAALSVPVVVLFGAHCRPINTGYELHHNLAIDDEEACGWRTLNQKCTELWKLITVEMVIGAVRMLLRERSLSEESTFRKVSVI